MSWEFRIRAFSYFNSDEFSILGFARTTRTNGTYWCQGIQGKNPFNFEFMLWTLPNINNNVPIFDFPREMWVLPVREDTTAKMESQ